MFNRKSFNRFIYLAVIPLDAKGTVQNGSMAYYNRTTATLMLQLKMLIHKHSNRKHQPPDAKQSSIMYRVELALVDHAHLASDSEQFNYCKKALVESAAACTDRHLFTPSYQQRDNGSVVLFNKLMFISLVYCVRIDRWIWPLTLITFTVVVTNSRSNVVPIEGRVMILVVTEPGVTNTILVNLKRICRT